MQGVDSLKKGGLSPLYRSGTCMKCNYTKERILHFETTLRDIVQDENVKLHLKECAPCQIDFEAICFVQSCMSAHGRSEAENLWEGFISRKISKYNWNF
jgi:hypothetical protein